MSTASTDSALLREVLALGVTAREGRWLVEEFAPGLDPDARSAVLEAAQRRLAGEPLQYVIGHWPFRSLDLDLDNRVLIPRPETEELVSVAMKELSRSSTRAPIILDLGCGSGAIGISLLVELEERGVVASLMALDVSEGALAVSRRNALKHNAKASTFFVSSWYDQLDASWHGRFDLIVSNPPYVAESEFESLDVVLRFEPRGAIVADDIDDVAGFADVAAVIDGAPEFLAPDGVLVLEHSEFHGVASRERAHAAGFSTAQTFCDLSGRDRFLVARLS